MPLLNGERVELVGKSQSEIGDLLTHSIAMPEKGFWLDLTAEDIKMLEPPTVLELMSYLRNAHATSAKLTTRDLYWDPFPDFKTGEVSFDVRPRRPEDP